MELFIIVVSSLIILLFILYAVLIGKFRKIDPQIVQLKEPILLIGTEIQTNDRDIYGDVGRIASRFNEIKKTAPVPNLKQPWASINISRDYDAKSKTFTYIMGDQVQSTDTVPDGLHAYEIPATTFAVFPVRPKSRFAWGITMGRMKRYIYTEWLPASGYRFGDTIGDFELHDERSLGKHPEIQLYVAVEEGNQGEPS